MIRTSERCPGRLVEVGARRRGRSCARGISSFSGIGSAVAARADDLDAGRVDRVAGGVRAGRVAAQVFEVGGPAPASMAALDAQHDARRPVPPGQLVRVTGPRSRMRWTWAVGGAVGGPARSTTSPCTATSAGTPPADLGERAGSGRA